MEHYAVYILLLAFLAVMLLAIYILHVANRELERYIKTLTYIMAELEALKRRIDRC